MVNGNLWTNSGSVNVRRMISKMPCAGPFVLGQRTSAVITCEDGRVVSTSFTIISGIGNGFGFGSDQFGNEFIFSFGVSESDATEKVNEYLKSSSMRPLAD